MLGRCIAWLGDFDLAAIDFHARLVQYVAQALQGGIGGLLGGLVFWVKEYGTGLLGLRQGLGNGFLLLLHPREAGIPALLALKVVLPLLVFAKPPQACSAQGQQK